MTTLFIIISYLIVFLAGRICGQFESAVLYSQRINSVIDAIKKVENLAALKGEDLSKVSTKELVERARKQMELKKDD